MQNVWERTEMHTEFWCVNVKGRDVLKDLGIDVMRIYLREKGQGGVDWINLAQDIEQLSALNTGMGFRVQ